MKKILIATLFLLLTVPIFAQAQDQQYIENNDFGFSFYAGFMYAEPIEYYLGRTYGINMIYHPVRFLSIEPSFMVSIVNAKERNNQTGFTDSDDNLMLGAGLGLFYYHHLGANLYLYVGPRGSYMRDESNSYDDSGSKSERRGFFWGVTATIGLKFLFNDHVGIFGDFGIGYVRHESTRRSYNSSGTITSDYTTEEDYWSAMSAQLGVCFYF